MKFLTNYTEQDNFWFSPSNFLSFVMNLLECLEKLLALFPDEYFFRNVASTKRPKQSE